MGYAGRRHLSQTAQNRSEYERLNLQLAEHFIKVPLENLDGAVRRAMRMVAEFCHADRAVIYSFDRSRAVAVRLYDWAEKPAYCIGKKLQTLMISDFEAGGQSTGSRVYNRRSGSKVPEDSFWGRLLSCSNIESLYSCPITIDGQVRGVTAFATAGKRRSWLGEESTVIGVFSRIMANILIRKERETFLHDTSRNNQIILDSINEGVGMYDRDGNTLQVNRLLAERYGKTREACVGLNIRDFVPEEKYGALYNKRMEKFDEAFNTGRYVCFEDMRDGRWYDNRFYPVYRNGRMTAVTLCSTDVTDKKTAEEEALLIAVLEKGAEIYRRNESDYLDILDASKKSEVIILRQNTILKSINKIYEKALSCENANELGAACLEMLKSITESSFGFIGEIGTDGRLNDIAISDTGWDQGGIDAPRENNIHRQLIIWELYDSVLKSGKSLRTNAPAEYQGRFTTPEGYPAVASFIGVPFLRDNKVTGILAAANRDGGFREEDMAMLEAIAPTVSEVLLRKKAEAKVRDNELLMRTIMDSSADFLFIKDKNSRIVLVNQAYGKIFGVDINNVIGKNDYELYGDPAVAEGIIENDRHVMCTGATLVCEESAQTLDGHRTYLLSKVPWRGTGGEILGILGIAHDITELKKTQAALQEMVTSLEHSKDYINILYETTGKVLSSPTPRKEIYALCTKVMRFLDCHAFFNYLLESEKPVMHLNACGGITDAQKQEIEYLPVGVAVCGCVVRDGRRIVAENIQTSDDPGTALVRSMGIRVYACHPLIADGKTIGSLSFGSRSKDRFDEEELLLMKTVADSVSVAIRRKQNEEQLLRQAEELIAADRNKNEFLSTLSHELRNPLAAISAGLSLLDLSDDKENQEKAKGIMHRQLAHLCHLVDDLLDMTRITRNLIVLKKERFELNEMALSVADDLSTFFKEKGVTLLRSISPDPVYIGADPVRIRQSIGNLLHNALKFTNDGDTVTLSVFLENHQACITVSDNGIGIEPEFMPNLFEPFKQADKSIDRRNGGLGLGLSIVKGIAELHGGTVTARSDGPGKGSAFSIRLPVSL